MRVSSASRSYTESGWCCRAVHDAMHHVVSGRGPVSGCGSISFPLGDLFGSSAQRTTPPADIVTGSVPPRRCDCDERCRRPQRRLSRPPSLRAPTPAAAPQELLSDDDREVVPAPSRARDARAGPVRPLPWLQPALGNGRHHHSRRQPSKQGPAVCRALLVTVQRGNATRTVQQCLPAPGYEWSLRTYAPFQAPA